MTAQKKPSPKKASGKKSAETSVSDGSNNDPKLTITKRKELERAILQQFALEPVPFAVTIKPCPTDIAVIAAVLSGENRATPDNEIIDSAINLWNKCALSLAIREREQKRLNAVRELLFKDQEATINRKVFLQRLLPGDSLEKRDEFLQDALERMLSTFLERFQIGGSGWPTERLSDLLGQEPSPAEIKTMRMYDKRITDEGVTLDLACVIAPLVLGWREVVSSPKFRGSVRQVSAKTKDAPATQSDDGQPDAQDASAAHTTDADCSLRSADSCDQWKIHETKTPSSAPPVSNSEPEAAESPE